MQEVKPILLTHNSHTRDNNIEFIEEGHIYKIHDDKESKYTSVTTWVHSHFEKFDADKIIEKMFKSKKWNETHKYWGKSAEEIKEEWNNNGKNASAAGTKLHYEIECFMNCADVSYPYTHKDLYDWYVSTIKDPSEYKEWRYFLNFIQDKPNMKPYRTEWYVYHDGLKFAGSIDMVYENPDGTLSIYDWKRSKEITKKNNFNKFATTASISELPDTNYWHYSLQLNTYKAILESKYGKKVKNMFLVRLHPDAEQQNYELLEVADLSSYITELFDLVIEENKSS